MKIQNVSPMILVVYADGHVFNLEPNAIITVNSLDARSLRLLSSGVLRIIEETPSQPQKIKKEEKVETPSPEKPEPERRDRKSKRSKIF